KNLFLSTLIRCREVRKDSAELHYPTAAASNDLTWFAHNRNVPWVAGGESRQEYACSRSLFSKDDAETQQRCGPVLGMGGGGRGNAPLPRSSLEKPAKRQALFAIADSASFSRIPSRLPCGSAPRSAWLTDSSPPATTRPCVGLPGSYLCCFLRPERPVQRPVLARLRNVLGRD